MKLKDAGIEHNCAEKLDSAHLILDQYWFQSALAALKESRFSKIDTERNLLRATFQNAPTRNFTTKTMAGCLPEFKYHYKKYQMKVTIHEADFAVFTIAEDEKDGSNKNTSISCKATFQAPSSFSGTAY